jgi:hypothetical protein
MTRVDFANVYGCCRGRSPIPARVLSVTAPLARNWHLCALVEFHTLEFGVDRAERIVEPCLLALQVLDRELRGAGINCEPPPIVVITLRALYINQLSTIKLSDPGYAAFVPIGLKAFDAKLGVCLSRFQRALGNVKQQWSRIVAILNRSPPNWLPRLIRHGIPSQGVRDWIH